MTEAPYHTSLLLAIDGSVDADRAALYVARRLARLGPCEVHVLYVHFPAAAQASAAQAGELVLEAGEATARARRALDEVALAYRFHTEAGDPVASILEVANREGCREIVMGSRGLGLIKGVVLGSVAYRVVHLSPVPVTVVPNPNSAAALDFEDDEVHRILLPVDGSSQALEAVDYVCDLGGAAVPVEVHLFNVQPSIASANVRRYIPQEAIAEYQRLEAEAALESARNALRGDGLRFDEGFGIGHPPQVIVERAATLGCTRIVMGARGLGAVAGMVLGSTALQVLGRSEIPVTIVR